MQKSKIDVKDFWQFSALPTDTPTEHKCRHKKEKKVKFKKIQIFKNNKFFQKHQNTN